MKKTGRKPAALQLIVFCIGIIAICPLRINLMMGNMDPLTGFYLDSADLKVKAVYIILAVAASAILVLSFVRRKSYTPALIDGRNIPLALASLVFAGLTAYETYDHWANGREPSATLLQKVELSDALLKIIPVFAALTVLWLLVYAISFISGKSIISKLKITALFPFLWIAAELVNCLIITIGYLNVSELTLQMLSLCARLWFVFSLARLTSGVEDGSASRLSLTSAALSLLLTLSYTLPRIILTLSGNAEKLVLGYPLSFADIGFCVFALVFALTMFLAPPRPEKIEENAAEEAPQDGSVINAPAVFPVLHAEDADIAFPADSVTEVTGDTPDANAEE
ncbi:MAG: hypothetical protein K6G90_12005 [Clostridia bacterium]|nr:hypothetical protein [Clostridia bacterium]